MERLTDDSILLIERLILQEHYDKEDLLLLVGQVKNEIEALRPKPFTVPVEIPPLYPEGTCSEKCPLICDGFCKKGWLTRKITDYGTPQYRTLLKPGPPCPRHEEGK